MTDNSFTQIACAIAALVFTTLSFGEVTSVQSLDFTYDAAETSAYEA